MSLAPSLVMIIMVSFILLEEFFDYYTYKSHFTVNTSALICFQEIKDLNEMITEIGGELGKIAEEEKRQTHDDIKVLEVKC